MDRDIARSILLQVGLNVSSPEELDEIVERFATTIERRCGDPIFPRPGESLAMSVMTPKTAALAFDRVYRIPVVNDPVPTEIGFYCGTVPEVAFWGGGLIISAVEQIGIDIGELKSTQPASAREAESLRFITSEFRQMLNTIPTIFYHSSAGYESDFPQGTHQVLTAAITNIAMVDEKSLSWDQVLEFRKDHETRAKYRRLVRWVDSELRTRSASEVQDAIAIRLDDYYWALKKHGLKASLGALSCMLDPKFLGTTSASIAASALAGGEVWAALAAGTLIIGQAAVSAGTALVNGLEERRKENYEVAYVYEVQKRLGTGT